MCVQCSALSQTVLIVPQLNHVLSLVQLCLQSCCTDYRYVDYLLDALRKRELFMWLELQPATFWHTLLFRFAITSVAQSRSLLHVCHMRVHA